MARHSAPLHAAHLRRTTPSCPDLPAVAPNAYHPVPTRCEDFPAQSASLISPSSRLTDAHLSSSASTHPAPLDVDPHSPTPSAPSQGATATTITAVTTTTTGLTSVTGTTTLPAAMMAGSLSPSSELDYGILSAQPQQQRQQQPQQQSNLTKLIASESVQNIAMVATCFALQKNVRSPSLDAAF